MNRKHLCYCTGIGLVVLLSTVLSAWGDKSQNDYTRLFELIQFEDRSKPLIAFNGLEKQADVESHKRFLGYFNDHPQIVKKIREKLGAKKIQWRLNNLQDRLVFVPEHRKEYADIFESYCKEVIEYLLDRTQLPDPDITIRTLHKGIPKPAATGVTAFLVHNLAKESIADFVFSNEENKKVQVQLKGTKFIGRVGAYSSTIYQEDDGSYEFSRDRVTIWQNSAQNPYTALMTPMEETLHILLRGSTEQGIKDHIQRNQLRHLKAVKKIASDWIRVEEAIVGGLVYHLLPSFLETHVEHFPDHLIEKDLRAKTKLKQYKYLKRGIQAVDELGLQKSLKIYQKDPEKFKQYLFETESA